MNAWDRLVAAVMRMRWIALAVSAALTAGAAALSFGIPYTSGVAEYLPANVPEVRAWLELTNRFEGMSALMVGLEEPSGPLSPEGLTALRRVTDKLAEQKAAGILGSRSVSNVPTAREAEDGLVNELIFSDVPKDKAGLEALSKRISADGQVNGALISRDQWGYVVLVRADPRKDASAIAKLVEDIVEKEKGPLKAYYFGAPFFTNQITKKVFAQLKWIVPLFVLLLVLVLALGVRRPGVIGLILGASGLSLVWWLGLVRLFGLGLSQTSAGAALPLLVLAAVAYARGLQVRLTAKKPEENPFPLAVVGGLAALALANLALSYATIQYLAFFGATVAAGLLAIALFGLLAFAPAASLLGPTPHPEAPPRKHFKTNAGLAAAVAALLVFGYVASGVRFLMTPQEMFAPDDEVGQTLSFFDRRFGGTDVIQLSFKGNLRDPSTAARLLRLTDLLEGSQAFGDVRSVAQVVGFLNKGFGGLHRIPSTAESLNNIWFFLEGSSDVKNLVSDSRDEAMLVLRVPVKPAKPMAELLAIAQSAVRGSGEVGKEAARLRLAALGRAFKVELAPAQIDAVIAAAANAPTAEEAKVVDGKVLASLQAFLQSGDSPYQPTAEEGTKLAEALVAPEAERKPKLTAAAESFEALVKGGMAGDFVETLLAREKDLRLSTRSQVLAQRLVEGKPGAPENLAVRATGVLADLLDPQEKAAAEVPVLVSGMPAVADKIEGDLVGGLWKAIAALLGLGGVFAFAFQCGYRKVVRAVLEGALATAITLSVCRLTGLQVDAGSATLYLLPPMLGFLTSGWVGHANGHSRRYPAAYLLGLAAAGCTLLFTGVLPVMRIGAGMAIGLCSVVLVSYLSGLFRTDPVPGAATTDG
ncbi:MAG TPA: MMPL family transporter [Myxococcales bacterium]|jgi:predicted RND superfamily exporter protein